MKLAGLQLSFPISHPVKKKICSLPPDSGNNMSTLQSTFFLFDEKIPCPKVWHSPFNDFWGDSTFIWLFIYQSFFVSQNSLRTYLISLCKQRPLHWYPLKLEYPTIAPTNGHRYPVPSPEIQHADTNTQLTDTLDQFTDSRLWYWNREIN